MNIKDFEVGQTVYVELIGDASRGRTAEERIEEWEITSVGRKYIKAGKRYEKSKIVGEITFEYNDYYKRFVEHTDYCINHLLYTAKQEIEESHEKNVLFDKISKRFSYGSQGNVTLEQLRAIHKILFESESKNANSPN